MTRRDSRNLKPWFMSPMVLMLLITVLGAALRFYHLGTESLWNDELSRWQSSAYPDFRSLFEATTRELAHPPGAYVLLNLVIRYLGDSEMWLRLPSALCGTLAIPLIYALGRRLYGTAEGLFAAALLAVTWAPIEYSQEVGPYAVLLFLACLTTYLLLVIADTLRDTGRLPVLTATAYILTAIVLAYLHYFGLMLVCLQGAGLVALVPRKAMLWAAPVLFLPVVAAYIPWMPYLGRQGTGPAIWIAPPTPMTAPKLLAFSFNWSPWLTGIAALFLMSLLVYSARQVFCRSHDRPYILDRPTAILLGWAVGPWVGAYLVSVVLTPVLTMRNLLISVPAILLLVSRGLAVLPVKAAARVGLAVTLAALCLGDVVFRMDYYTPPHKQQFREAVQWVLGHDSLCPSAPVVVYAWHKDYFNYYFDHLGSARRVALRAGDGEDIDKLSAWQHSANATCFWYLAGHRKPAPDFLRYLNEHFRAIDHHAFLGVEVWLFQTQAPEVGQP